MGCHRRLGPPGPGRRRRRPRGHRRHRLHLAVVGDRAGRRRRGRHRTGHHLDGLPRRPRRPRDRARGAERPGVLRLQAGQVGAPHRRHPEPVGQGPGGPHPLPAPAASRRLRRRRRLPRAGRLPRPAPHRPGPGLARLHHLALGDRQPRHQRRGLRRLADGAGGPPAVQAARTGPDRQCPGRAGPRRRSRARPPPRHAGGGRHGGPALGRGRLGCRGRLRRPPLHRHLQLDQLPRPVQEDGRADQHRLLPLGHPGPLPGGRRARDGGRLPDLAARQRALPERRPHGQLLRSRRRPPSRPRTSSPPSTTWRRPSPSARTACSSRPG